MQPNQLPGNDSSYDFIMGGQPAGPYQNPRDKKRRLLVMAGGGAILLMVFAVVFSLIFGGGNEGTEKLVALAQQQSELMRVADIGAAKGRGSAAQNLAVTTKLSVASSQTDLLAFITKQGRKLPAKELALAENLKTDELLTAAEQNNRFDETFTEVITKQLTAYEASLQQAATTTNSKAGKEVLTTAYRDTQTLLGKAPTP